MQYKIIKINKRYKMITNQKPIVIIDNIKYYILNDDIKETIKKQLIISNVGKACYRIVGDINNNIVKINDNVKLEIDISNLSKYYYGGLDNGN